MNAQRPLPPAVAARPSQRARTREAGAGGLRDYLQAIVGREPSSSLLELRPLRPGGGAAPGRAWIPVGELTELERRIRALTPGANVFISVAPRTRREGHVGSVERSWCLWTDCDTEESLERLRTFRPLPAIVVRSGSGGAHAYWPLHEPLTPAQTQRANRRLALALGADAKATDAARILRPPGTLNHKHSPPRPAFCSRLEAVRFTAAEVVGQLPDSHHYARPQRRPLRRLGDGSARPERVLDGLARVVAHATRGERNAVLFWAVCRAVEHADARELHLGPALDVLSTAALEAGLGGEEIRATIGSAQRTTRRAA